MNPRVYRWLPGILFLGIFALVPAALAQTAPTIDDKDKISNSVPRATIQQHIAIYVAALGGEDAEARTQARDALIGAGVAKVGTPAFSPGYLDTYADLLNTALKPLATSPNMVVRLNTAIVVAKVAKAADNTRLLEVDQLLLADKSEGVQLWALRAARYILPAELRVPGAAKNDKLIPAIVAVTRQRNSGTITNEAYNALSLDYQDRAKLQPLSAAVKVEMFGAVIPQVHAIMRSRIAAYAAGNVSEPGAEKDAANFLVNAAVSPLMDPKTRTATLQVLLDLMTTAAGAAQKAPAGKNMDLIQTVRDTGKAITVPFMSDPNAATLSRALKDITESQNMKPWEQIAVITQELVKLDKGLKPTSAPATAPSGN